MIDLCHLLDSSKPANVIANDSHGNANHYVLRYVQRNDAPAVAANQSDYLCHCLNPLLTMALGPFPKRKTSMEHNLLINR
jgi:hypothetical protein